MKASILVDARTHALWAAAAALRGMDRSAFAVEAIKEACRGLVIVDRRKKSGPVILSESADDGVDVISDDEKAA